MEPVLKDLRYAVRGLVRSPGVSLIAVLALALGIGLTTVMFSIVYGALYRGLPFEGAARIMHVGRANPSQGFTSIGTSIHVYRDWSERQRSFEALAAFYTGTVNVRGTERPDRYDGGFMSTNAFDVLGVRPLIGRGFVEEDGRPGAPMVLLLGYQVWQDRYGGSRDVLGQPVTVNGQRGEIIGVMPEGLEFPVLQEVWIPLRLDPVALPRGSGQRVEVYGRLREGVGLDQAMVEFTGITDQLAVEYPEGVEGVVPVIKPYTEEYIGDEEKGILYAMLATVALVLLIACANVANLLLARAAMRTRDVAIRTAMGADRWRVLVQMLAEALVLALVGAALGTLLAWVGIGMFDRVVQPTDPPFWLVWKLDGPILGFVALASVTAAVVSGAIPALRASSTDINAILKDESRGSSSLQIGRLSRVLVVAEVAMSMALLVASGLMIKSVLTLGTLDYGFPSEDVFTARIGLFEERFPDMPSRQRFWDDVEERIAALPGVRQAALVSELPGLGSRGAIIAIDGETYEAARDMPRVRWSLVSPRFFETFEVSVLQGRALTRLDGPDSDPVIVVNESFARRFFADGQVLGRRVRLGNLDSQDPWREVVGVVPDLRMEGIGDPDEPAPEGFYVPLAQGDSRFLSVAARTSGPPLALTPLVRDAVTVTDPDTPVYFVDSLQGAIDDQMWFYGVFGTLFAVFGAAALFLASVGLYGVMSFSVSRRVQEMGIRMALGAEGRQVLRLVLGQGLAQVAIGLVLGAGLAVLVARGLDLLLYGSRPWDPATYVTVVALLTLTGLIASYVPARRATRVDPMEALRYE